MEEKEEEEGGRSFFSTPESLVIVHPVQFFFKSIVDAGDFSTY